MSNQRDVTHLTDISKGLSEADGSFKRKPSTFRGTIEKGGEFEPEKDRYHLYVAYSCPWATRTLIVRKIKGLEDYIGVSVVSPRLGENGWAFANVDPYPGADVDPLNGAEYIKDLYLKVQQNYEGRFTVPVLWDKKTETIVNNESSEIIRIFNTAFNEILPSDKAAIDLYPVEHRPEIDEINDWVYDTVNNGVYKAGFATVQQAYEEAVIALFNSLDRLEEILTGKDYLVGNRLTEADVRLFVTIVRFDPVYVGHFKCNLRTIRGGYPAIHLWLRKLYWNNDAFSSTCKFDYIKTSYYWQKNVNPHRIVPVGPIPDILPL
ncbi:glutathione S-transferase [Cubamyces sp. BRFM 1775]|nr:glutathione S-transferase [Cubamyces sp. BRFM 1775]